MNLEIRKSIYSVLFSKPLFDYTCTDDKGNYNINVLIAGYDEECIEAFKAVYWCGQLSEKYRLNITLLCESIAEMQKKLYQDMPAINNGSVEANIIFANELKANSLSGFGYCFISKQYESLMAAFKDIDGTRLICTFFEDFSQLGNNEILCLKSLQLFEKDLSILNEYAFNCDFAYRMGENERCEKGTFLDFIKSGEGQGKYNYLSSLSFPVHIPYKMRVCADENKSDKDTIQVLLGAIKDKNELFDKLLEIEHRRWMAYMISEGWRMPSDDELQLYAFDRFGYEDGKDQREKSKKLHPCICRGSSKGCVIDRHAEIWSLIEKAKIHSRSDVEVYLKKNYPDEVFSELEVITLVLYGIVCNKALENYEQVDSLFDFILKLDDSKEKKAYENLKRSSKKLLNDELNSSKLYLEAVKDAKAIAIGTDYYENIITIEQAMRIYVEKNKKKNYFTIDSTMINMIPFCLWYGRENNTIVTVSAGLAMEDVVVPTILCAETAIFIEKEKSTRYEEAIKEFFKISRRNNTKVVFVCCDANSQEEVINCIDQLNLQYKNIALNCVSNSEAATIMSIGALADSKGIPVYTYSYNNGIENIKNGNLISPGLNSKSLSVDEMVLLTGGNYSNVYAKTPYIRELDELEEIFINYSEEKELSIDGRKKVFSAWSALSNLFQSASKNLCPEIVGDYRKTVFQADFDKTIFRECGLMNFLPLLEQYFIIKDYQVLFDKDDNKPFVRVKFKYYDSGIERLLRPYSVNDGQSQKDINNLLKTRLAFSTSSGIVLMSLVSERAQLCNIDEQEEIKESKIQFIKDLEKRKMITSLSFDSNKEYVALEFIDFTIKNIFKNQGKLFELLLYYKIRNSGIFNDVQTGVRVSWDSVKETRDEMIRNYLKSSQKYGYNIFLKAKREIDFKYRNENLTVQTDNEIDIVMTCGMTPIFVSCKTAKSGGNEWLYEIASVSDHFNAYPVLALTKNLDSESSSVFLSRARRMNVSVIGYETIFDADRLNFALNKISKGLVVMGPDTKEG